MEVYNFVLGRILSVLEPHAIRGFDSPVLHCSIEINSVLKNENK